MAMQQRHALLVDDSKSARFALRLLLQKHGFIVDMADSGYVALEMLKDNKPDAIFMDHMMPGLDGFEVTKRIKENPDTAHIPVVMCTSNDEEKYLRQARSLGSLGILPKPATPEKLDEILATVEQEIQAAELPEPRVAASVARTPALSPVLTETEIEGLIHNLLPSILRDALKPMVEELTRAQLQQNNRALLDQASVIAAESGKQAVTAATPGLRDEFLISAMEQSQTLIASATRRTATEIVEHQLKTQGLRMRQEITDNLNSLKTELPQDPAIIQLLQSIATKSAAIKAKDIATQISRDTARTISKNAAEEAALKQAAEASTEVKSTLKSLSRRISLLAFGAAALGMAAAAGVYFVLS